ncbi:MAG: glutamate racemase [Clostridia bacterium]|nr:glutamate racemase [Clostridia bacterium]
MNNKPIGVFDSGLGGLTAVKEIINVLPNEDIIYFGDTARVPYGSRSSETIIKYAKQDISFLKSFDIKIILAACGTVSSVALPEIPCDKVRVVGVVEPAAIAAVKATKNKKIAVLGTKGTIDSKAYETEIKKLMPDAKITSIACPMFVHLVENGYSEHEATYLIAKEYLKQVIDNGADTVILGCTHYPMLKKVISKVLGENVSLIDVGKAAANYLKEILDTENKLSELKKPSYEFYVSDAKGGFEDLAKLFLKRDLGALKSVDIDKIKED